MLLMVADKILSLDEGPHSIKVRKQQVESTDLIVDFHGNGLGREIEEEIFVFRFLEEAEGRIIVFPLVFQTGEIIAESAFLVYGSNSFL